MPFTIPNDIDAFDTNQAEFDRYDLDIMLGPNSGNGVISGCAVTAQGSPTMNLDVASGIICVNGDNIVVSSGTVTIGTAHATLPRFDLVVVNNSGVKSVTAGTAAADPVFPAIPSNSIVLAAVFVPATVTTITSNKIVDKRNIMANGASGRQLGYAARTTNFVSTSLSGEDITGCSTTVVVGARPILVTGYCGLVGIGATAGYVQMRIYEGANLLQIGVTDPVSNGWGYLEVKVRLSPSSGSHTYKLVSLVEASGMSATYFADPTFPMFILVEEL
jgi:hypothetical protein